MQVAIIPDLDIWIAQRPLLIQLNSRGVSNIGTCMTVNCRWKVIFTDYFSNQTSDFKLTCTAASFCGVLPFDRLSSDFYPYSMDYNILSCFLRSHECVTDTLREPISVVFSLGQSCRLLATVRPPWIKRIGLLLFHEQLWYACFNVWNFVQSPLAAAEAKISLISSKSLFP